MCQNQSRAYAIPYEDKVAKYKGKRGSDVPKLKLNIAKHGAYDLSIDRETTQSRS